MTDEPLYRDRVCGIDIGKAGMVVTIRVPSDANPKFPPTRLVDAVDQVVEPLITEITVYVVMS